MSQNQYAQVYPPSFEQHSYERTKRVQFEPNQNATYVPYGSFQAPFTVQGLVHNMRVVSPPGAYPSPDDTPRPLHACPGLPQPNREMKYFSWKSSNRDSHVNLQKMTHHDHSMKSNSPASKCPANDANVKVNDAEMDAAVTLASCLSQAHRWRPVTVSSSSDRNEVALLYYQC